MFRILVMLIGGRNSLFLLLSYIDSMLCYNSRLMIQLKSFYHYLIYIYLRQSIIVRDVHLGRKKLFVMVLLQSININLFRLCTIEINQH